MDENVLTIIIGGDMDKDDEELLTNPEKAIKTRPRNALYLDTFEQLYDLLSPKKLDLLRRLINYKYVDEEKNVGEIAKDLDRQQEAISRDLHYLKSLKLIELKKTKQSVIVNTHLKAIKIEVVGD